MLVLNNVEHVFTVYLGAAAHIMEQGALALAIIGIWCSLVFIAFKIIGALTGGGGANLIAVLATQLFIVLGLFILIQGFGPFIDTAENDFNAYAARLANISTFVVNFTPDGILHQNDAITSRLYAQGAGLPFMANLGMVIYKWSALALIQFGNGILAMDLLFADIFIRIVAGTVAFLIGLLINPWFKDYAMKVVSLLFAALVFKVVAGAFVGLSGALAAVTIDVLGTLAGVPMSGDDMIFIGVLNFLFAVLAVLVPWGLASAIAGANPIMSFVNVVNSARSGLSTIRV